MKEKVLAILKPLVASKGFKKTELEGLADIVAKNLTDASTDEEINNAVSGVLPYADLMQAVGNRYVSEIEKKYEGWIDPKKNPPVLSTPPTPPADEPKALTLEEVQKMIQDGISAGLKPFREREESERLRSILYANEKVRAIPESFRSRYTLDKEENLETLASQMENDYATLKQELLKSGEFAAPPSSGGGAGSSDDLIAALQAMGAKASQK